MFKFIAGDQDQNVNLSREDRVPMFWADSTGEDVAIGDLIMLAVGGCFGAIHCVVQVFSFPAHIELSIWRKSNVAITAVPVYIPWVLSWKVWASTLLLLLLGIQFSLLVYCIL